MNYIIKSINELNEFSNKNKKVKGVCEVALVTMKEMLITARREGYAVGAFEFWSYDSAKAIVECAQERKSPVILQVGHFERDYMDGYLNARRIAGMIAEKYSVPIALHLDHAETYDEVLKALEAGFTSVMIDASAKSFEDNVFLTSEVVKLARHFGASVEAEIGQLEGIEGNMENSASHLTDPRAAREFVEKTKVDALAVAIGTAHGLYKSEPHIDLVRMKEISETVSIPLVLHGGSGTPETAVQEAIRLGIAKVNICTEFIKAFGEDYLESQIKENFTYNVMTLFEAARCRAKELVRTKMALFDPDHKLG